MTYQFTYTTNGSAITATEITDPRGHVRRHVFNAAHYRTQTIEALGTTEQRQMVYERQAGTNLVTAVVDGLNRRTALSYDANGHVTSVTRLSGTPAAVTSTFTYEPKYRATRVHIRPAWACVDIDV